jgi:branched-chain amino acid transport system ATP-binding protein/urea transport system ATP-binding protein
VSFSLRERELRCLIGPNGAGKSTFFKCLTGQYRLSHENGRVLIRGTDVPLAHTRSCGSAWASRHRCPR